MCRCSPPTAPVTACSTRKNQKSGFRRAGVVEYACIEQKKDEAIVIGDSIRITVIEIQGDKVRLGIEAPRELAVYRQEIYDAIREENRLAAQTATGIEGLIKELRVKN